MDRIKQIPKQFKIKQFRSLNIFQMIFLLISFDYLFSKRFGVTIAAGDGGGNQLNQFAQPSGVFIHDDQLLYIAVQQMGKLLQVEMEKVVVCHI